KISGRLQDQKRSADAGLWSRAREIVQPMIHPPVSLCEALRAAINRSGVPARASPNNQNHVCLLAKQRNWRIIMNQQSPNRLDLDHTITRRKFIGTTAASSAALLGGGLTSLLSRSALAAHDFDFLEKSIPELQAAMASGQVSSKELVKGYLRRIASLNPLLNSVIETNPNAVSIAQHLDNERRRGFVRGPLHGIPVLVKDNIATDDNMETT